ncbi:uncharacterized protein RCC_02002 [Ramularia collo-cygni]|uniref:Uncharacterized protein n=1 Tax=Ramularia collo-cygni TaxID=112498 RepID=A0A2D3UN80_9PEZI|nr:uncharacterized protein RCC_02002 [Ramularia collo-cygni]CZT16161.1 uncharacterized protein RCC_02002 [Ramularia collo-cygni]
MKTTAALSSLAALASLAAAFPTAGTNWETYTNDLGYTTTRFKPGMEPGSLDYDYRFGSSNATTDLASIAKRQESRSTQPLVGETAIPYGCRTDIPGDILSKLSEICGDLGCDSGASTSVEVTYPDNGMEQPATVSISAEGRWPSGMQEAMIEAVKAEAIPEAVEIEEVVSIFTQNSPHNPGREYRCDVSKSSNFFSVVVRNNDDDGMVGQLDVSVSFTQSKDSVICGTIGEAGAAIVGAINGIAGGFFGVVQALVC